MATNLNQTQQSLLVEALPDYLQEVVSDSDFQEWEVPSSQPIGRLSIEGGHFRLLYLDAVGELNDDRGYPARYWDFVFVKAHDKVSRVYYERGFVQGSKDAPDCSSIDGVLPEPGSPKMQGGPRGVVEPGAIATCGKCKWSKFGTAIGADGRPSKGQRCSQKKRVTLLLSGDMANTDFGGPVLLTIPPTSFAAFEEYYKKQRALGRPLHLINTRMSFAQAPHAKLDFEFVSFVNKEERDAILWWRDSNTDGGAYVERMLRIEPSAEDDTEQSPVDGLGVPVQQVQVAPEPVPAPAPTPAPVPPQRVTPQARPQPPRIQQSAQTPIPQPPQQAATRATQAPAAARAQTLRPQVPIPNQPPTQAGTPTPRPRPAPAAAATQSGLIGPATTTRPNGPVRQHPQSPQPPQPPQNYTTTETEYAEVEQIVSDLGDQDFTIP